MIKERALVNDETRILWCEAISFLLFFILGAKRFSGIKQFSFQSVKILKKSKK
jgi:hypothetical protein